MSETGSDSLQVDVNLPLYALQYAVVVKEVGASQGGRKPTQVVIPVANNVFTWMLEKFLGFSNTQVQVLTKDVYYTPNTVLY